MGHSDLGGKVRALCSGILDVYAAMLDVYPRCLSPLGVEKKKKKFSNSQRELGEFDALDRTTLGAALDAGGRSGPRWTGDAWLARRRRYSTARRDRVMT